MHNYHISSNNSHPQVSCSLSKY